MKEYRVKPSKSPVTTYEANGRMNAYFTSSVLGRCRAILLQDCPVPYELTPQALAFIKKEKSHVDLVNEEIELFEKEVAKKAEKEAEKHLCDNCVQGGWFIDHKDGKHKFLMPPYPTVDTICKVCGGYASPERKARGEVRWGENK